MSLYPNSPFAWLIPFTIMVGLWCETAIFAQTTQWDKFIQTGLNASRQGKYADAERAFSSALDEAKKFGAEDIRLAQTLKLIAVLYGKEGKYAEAEPLFKRSLAISEKTSGATNPEISGYLNNLAVLYCKQASMQKLSLYLSNL